MIKDFFTKKENIFISGVALVSVFCIVLGFLFLFFKTDSSDGPRTIPTNIYEIIWNEFSSKLLDKKIQYPEYMYIEEQKKETGVGITMSEFEPKEFLTYFSNQNHISLYPSGLDNQFFYAKTRQSDFTSSMGQEFTRTEYLTTTGEIWAVMLVPKTTPSNWQPRGFIWIQSAIKTKEDLCMSGIGTILTEESCDPYTDQKPVYKGEVSGQFLRFGYEIVNKNSF